jgi:hypothetical protein
MNLRGVLLVWIGLMGLSATVVSFALLRLFPRAFAESGPAVAWPLRRAESRSARVRGWLIVVVVLVSAGITIAGLVSLLS